MFCASLYPAMLVGDVGFGICTSLRVGLIVIGRNVVLGADVKCRNDDVVKTLSSSKNGSTHPTWGTCFRRWPPVWSRRLHLAKLCFGQVQPRNSVIPLAHGGKTLQVSRLRICPRWPPLLCAHEILCNFLHRG